MRYKFVLAGLVLLIFIGGLTPVARALNAPSDLDFEAINITDDELLRLKNNGTGNLELADYWLGYAGSDDPAVLASPTEQLPDLQLGAGGELLLSGVAGSPCGAELTGKLPFTSFSNTVGQLAIWHFGDGSFSKVSSLSWGAAPGDDLNIKNGERKDVPSNVWYRDDSAQNGPSWLVGSLDNCIFSPFIVDDQSNFPLLAAGDYPTFTIVSPSVPHSPSLLAAMADRGLAAPIINELLPNPASPETDERDEFIELYNPNSKIFDLSGFKLSVGSLSSAHVSSYTLPAGTIVKPGAFIVFKSDQTGLSLPNGGGQVWLLDPTGKIIANSGVYGTAKDGYTFARTGQSWVWSLQATPGQANTVMLAASQTSSTTGNTNTPKISGTPVELSSTNGSSTGVKGASTGASDVEPAVSVHPSVLAVIAILALAYFLYEYRADLANKFIQLKAYRAARRANRR